jgi:hypothetical protein
MSIAEGALPVTVTGIRAPKGTYALRGAVNTHAFAATLRVRY